MTGGNVNNICGFECLYESHLKAKQGVLWKDSVAWYALHGLEQTLKLSQELTDGTYKQKPPISFTIYKPKKRDIVAIAYRDRVYQRAINDNALYPAMTKSFVKENGACQTGRGVDYERDKILYRNLRKYYINQGSNEGYVLQIDIRHYYPSMNHEIVYEHFKPKVKEDVYDAVVNILEGQYEGEVGYNPGSQMVQIAGISLLDGVDHYIKEKLKVKYYARYMDDLILIHPDEQYLEFCRGKIEKELNKLKLEMHPDKTRIYELTDGITFLGFDWELTDTGKVIMKARSQNVKDLRHTINKLLKMYAKGERTLKCVNDSYMTRRSYLAKGNTYNLLTRLDAWYIERLKEYGVSKENIESIRKSIDGQSKSRKRKA